MSSNQNGQSATSRFWHSSNTCHRKSAYSLTQENAKLPLFGCAFSSSSCSGDRCSVNRVESVETSVPVSPDRSHSCVSLQARDIRRTRNPRRAISSSRSMVAKPYDPVQVIKRRARYFFSLYKAFPRWLQHEASLTFRAFSFLTHVFSLLYQPTLAEALVKSLRDSTNSQYESCWKQ